MFFFLAVFILMTESNSVAVSQDFWKPSGPDSQLVASLAVSPNGDIFSGIHNMSGGIFRSTDNGDTWTQTGLKGDTSVWCMAVNAAGDIFAGTYYGVFRSTNNGETWTPTGDMSPYVSALAISGNGHIFSGAASDGSVDLFRSTDNGDTWELILTFQSVSSLAVNSSGHIFAGASSWFGGHGGVFRSTNDGASWDTVITGLTDRNTYCLGINSNEHVFVSTGSGVFRSTDNGDNWTPVNNGLTSTHVWTFAINSSGHIFAGSDSGVFRSTNNGILWDSTSTGLTNRNVHAFVITSADYVFAGTARGVFRSVHPTTPVREVSAQLPVSFGLEQNFPNPFNPSTNISFTLPASGYTSLMVFDLLGREVVTLVNEELALGSYEVTWEAAGFPSGIYFYRLRSGTFYETKKLVLMR